MTFTERLRSSHDTRTTVSLLDRQFASTGFWISFRVCRSENSFFCQTFTFSNLLSSSQGIFYLPKKQSSGET